MCFRSQREGRLRPILAEYEGTDARLYELPKPHCPKEDYARFFLDGIGAMALFAPARDHLFRLATYRPIHGMPRLLAEESDPSQHACGAGSYQRLNMRFWGS